STPDSETLSVLQQRVTDLEKKVKELKNVNHPSTLTSVIRSKVPTVVKEYLGTSLDDALYKVLQRNNAELKKELFEQKSYKEVINEFVQAYVMNEVLKQLPTFLPTTVSEFAIYETLEKNPHILAETSSQPQSSYKIATSLIEIKLKRVLMDKMTKSQYYLIDDTQKILYDALVTAYKRDKDLFNTYGQTVVLKRTREDDDNQDEDPTTRSNQGLKRRKTSKETETSKKSSTSKDSSKGKFPATSSKSSKSTKEQVEEPIFVKDSDNDTEFDNVEIPMDQEEELGNTDEQLNEEVAPKHDWYKKSKEGSSSDPEWNVGKSVDDGP
ncbi:hypothetical protein Tco_1077050, partial [Tanacetum coccineum]